MTIMSRTSDTSTAPDLDILNSIEEALDQEELEWAPTEAGDQIIGYITAIEYVDTKNGPVAQLKVTNKDGAAITVWCGRTRLKNQLARAKAQPGDAVGIRYLGQQDSTATGNKFHDYKVHIQRVGPRNDAEMFRADDDLGLTPGAYNTGQWTANQGTDEAPF